MTISAPAQTTANTIGAASSPNSATTPSNQLSSANYLQLFLSSLKYQDPTQPMSTATMLQQEAELTTIQEQTQMAQDLQSLTQAMLGQEITQGGNLIGKTVTGTDANGNSVTGSVSKVNIQNGSVYLTINNSTVALNQLQSVS